MSLNSKKDLFQSWFLAAAAGMVQAANSSCLLCRCGFVARAGQYGICRKLFL